MKIDLQKYAKQYEAKLIKSINESTVDLLEEVNKNSPIDTGDYIAGNKRELAIIEGDKIIGTVYNDSKNNENVEFGWRITEVNWSKYRRKGGPVIHRGIGATTFLRSYINMRDKIKAKIIKDLG